MLTMSNHEDAILLPLLSNLQQAVSANERRKHEQNTDIHLPPRYAKKAKEIRQEIVDWLVENGPSTASQVAAHFGFHKTTAHSYLNRMVYDGQAQLFNKHKLRFFCSVDKL